MRLAPVLLLTALTAPALAETHRPGGAAGAHPVACTPIPRTSKERPAILATPGDTVSLRDGWLALGLEPTETRMRISAAIAAHETGFARGWAGDGAGSNNWGAAQSATPTCPGSLVGGHCRAPGACPAGTFLATDGDVAGRYWTCFRAYRSADKGARHFVQLLVQRMPCQGRELDTTMLEAIDSGSPSDVARALYATCYFTTHRGQPDPEGRISEYAAAIEQHLDSVDSCWLERSLAAIKHKDPASDGKAPAADRREPAPDLPRTALSIDRARVAPPAEPTRAGRFPEGIRAFSPSLLARAIPSLASPARAASPASRAIPSSPAPAAPGASPAAKGAARGRGRANLELL
jgi:hypothetical protein